MLRELVGFCRRRRAPRRVSRCLSILDVCAIAQFWLPDSVVSPMDTGSPHLAPPPHSCPNSCPLSLEMVNGNRCTELLQWAADGVTMERSNENRPGRKQNHLFDLCSCRVEVHKKFCEE